MKTKIISTLAACLVVRLLATPAVPGEWQQSLNGPWQFTTNIESATWDSITVPGNWDTLPAYSTYQGKGWYRREFTAPANWQGKHIRLKFDAVYQDATVWLNGQGLGRHIGGYTPFEFDVTGIVKSGTTNTVTVCADNTYQRGAWWNWGGISRSVTLIANNDARIVSQHIRTEPDLTRGTARIFVQYQLANTGEKPAAVLLASTIDGTQESALTKQVSIPARGKLLVELATTLPKPRVRLWDFDHPNLYHLTTTLTGGKQIVDEQTDAFGIRKIEVTKDSLLLNGERVRLCGFNRVADSLETGNTEPEWLVKKDVDLMKRANGNLSRLIHYPQAPDLLDYLDRKGMLIFGEIPVWGGGDPQMKAGSPLARQWMTEMIERDYNHPCIIGWSVGNELEHHFTYVSNLITFTRTLDPYRLITHVSNTGVRKDYNPTNDPISVSDLILYNMYGLPGNADVIVHAKWPDKPFFFSEFGVHQFGAQPDARIPGLEELFANAVKGHPYVIGVSLWTFNDYRSNFKGTPPSGNREWGIVDVKRQPKAAYGQVRKLFSPVHSLTVTNGVIQLVPRSPDEVPSFTLRGYQLKWDGGGVALPDLNPGAPVWTSQQKVKSGTVVKLISPTGYDVADTQAEP